MRVLQLKQTFQNKSIFKVNRRLQEILKAAEFHSQIKSF